jgi:predicted acylesterase/phospholipase RssA
MPLANREAVIAIQGGGVWALSLLGQARAVLSAGYTPLAIAGTSGGAILASLLWSGLTPREIEGAFIDMVQADRDALVDLLGDFDPPPPAGFTYAEFRRLGDEVTAALRGLDTWGEARPSAFARWYRAAGLMRRASRLWSALAPHIARRGIFRGAALEAKLNELLCRGLGMPDLGRPVRFSDVDQRMRASGGAYYRPVLLLTATNLSQRRLDLISSADPRYANVPVAAAVRASAGFPVFFRPRELPDCPGGGWFVDGGVIANFPLWAFSAAFRDQVRDHPAYQWLAARPWVRIGLRIVDDAEQERDVSTPQAYLQALLGMLTGIARNELEEVLSRNAVRTLVLRQPVRISGAPDNILDVPAIDGSRIATMVTNGHRFASEELRRAGYPAVYQGDAGDVLCGELESLIGACNLVLGADAPVARLRANVFVAVETRLHMIASHNMAGDPDDGLVFPELSSGLTGACYQARACFTCNLQTVAAVAGTAPGRPRPFRMDPGLQSRIRPDRTWLASMPIFDPYEVGMQHGEAARVSPETLVAARHRGLSLDGPVLGTLNVDAAWDYAALRLSPEPELHVTDPRIAAILALMEAKTLILARRMTIVAPS